MQKTTIDYLKSLKKNNNKEWFDKNRARFDLAKEDFLQLTSSTIQYLSTLNPGYENLKPKDCIFRQNKDIRFSKDKSPYKTNMGAAFSIGGKKSAYAAFYFHLEPGNSFIGGGLWMPDADKLKKIRQEIDYDFESFKKIITKKDFVHTFGALNEEEKLKNPPKGYESENKAIEFLKLKSFVAGHRVADAELLENNFPKKVEETFKILAPFIDFLNRAVAE